MLMHPITIMLPLPYSLTLSLLYFSPFSFSHPYPLTSSLSHILSHLSPISPPPPLSLQGGPGGGGHNLGPLSSDLLPPGGLGGTVAATRGLRGVNMPSMGALAAPNGHLMPPMGGQNHNMGGMGPGQGQQR